MPHQFLLRFHQRFGLIFNLANPALLSFVFEHFLIEFTNPNPRKFECPTARSRRGICFASSTFYDLYIGAQPSFPFQAMKKRVDGTWSQAVSVASQFLNNPEAEDGFLRRVM